MGRLHYAEPHVEQPQFMLVRCILAEEFLAANERYLSALASDDGFARQMKKRGIDSTDLAITVTPVTIEFDQACSDTGPTFISFFDDMRIERIRSVR